MPRRYFLFDFLQPLKDNIHRIFKMPIEKDIYAYYLKLPILNSIFSRFYVCDTFSPIVDGLNGW